MRIAQIAPLAEAVPPKLYGGTERVISWLTEALVELGHDVTLYASADSETSARHVRCAAQGQRLAGINAHVASLISMLEQVRRVRTRPGAGVPARAPTCRAAAPPTRGRRSPPEKPQL